MKLQDIIASATKEFREKFCNPAGLNNYPQTNTHDIKSFLSSAITSAIKEAFEAVRVEDVTSGVEWAPERVTGKNAFNASNHQRAELEQKFLSPLSNGENVKEIK